MQNNQQGGVFFLPHILSTLMCVIDGVPLWRLTRSHYLSCIFIKQSKYKWTLLSSLLSCNIKAPNCSFCRYQRGFLLSSCCLKFTVIPVTVTTPNTVSATSRRSHIAPFPGCTWAEASGRTWGTAVSCAHFLVWQSGGGGLWGGRGGD